MVICNIQVIRPMMHHAGCVIKDEANIMINTNATSKMTSYLKKNNMIKKKNIKTSSLLFFFLTYRWIDEVPRTSFGYFVQCLATEAGINNWKGLETYE